MINYGPSNDLADLNGILELQKANLISKLTPEEIKSQGFVTVVHSLDDLTKLNNIEKHIIAKSDEEVVAYILAMTSASRNDIPILVPMFDTFDSTSFKGKFISEYPYMVVGQVCVGKAFRGKRVLDGCYQEYKNQFCEKYDFAITEIDVHNTRSLRAHERIGFQEIVRYHTNGIDWAIVLWDWNG